MRKTVTCGDGRTRTGTVIYIGPIFQTLEFEGKSGNWREAFFLPVPPDKLACGSEQHDPILGKRYTAAEIRVLYEPISNREAAEKIGRSLKSVQDARNMRGIRVKKAG